jgi:hypothetical protein
MPEIVKPQAEDAAKVHVWRYPYALLLVCFAVSRMIYYLLGVRFDARGINGYLQFIDPELLRNHLLQSLFYLHWQAPGYNLFLGIILKLFPLSYASAFHIIHIALGSGITCMLYYLMRSLGVGVRLALTATILFIVSPGVVLFENFILYEYQIAFFLIVSATLLIFFFRRRCAAAAIGFLVCQFWLVVMRNQYQLAYFIVIFILLVYFAKHNKRLVSFVGSVLLAAIFTLYLKNFILFGHFTSSTWPGMCIGQMLEYQLTSDERRSFVSQGKLSPATMIADCTYPVGKYVGNPISAYRPFIPIPTKTCIPVLDQEFKSFGVVNYNHIGYLEVQKLYMKDIRFLIRHYPVAYWRMVAKAWYSYFLPESDFLFFDLNLPRISAIERFSNIVLCGQIKHVSVPDRHKLWQRKSPAVVLYTGIFLLIGLPALFIYGTWFLYRSVRRRMLDTPQALLFGFLLFSIAYCTVTTNFLSCYENNRYRFPIDGFFVVLAAVAVDRLIRRVTAKRIRFL